MILPQCAGFLRENAISRVRPLITPGRTRSGRRRRSDVGALASELAAEIYGLDVLARHIEDQDSNTTRFLVMARDAEL